MMQRSTREHLLRVRRHSYGRLTCTAILVGLAMALPFGGFGATNARATSVAATTWKAQDASSAGSVAGLHSVAFADAAHGWAVGYATDSAGNSTPVILATSDGGATWRAQDASSAGSNAALYSVTFPDAAHGWAVGYATDSAGNSTPVILATSNGGGTWKAQDASGAGGMGLLQSVWFVDAAHGWAVGDGNSDIEIPLILATSDGGASWNAQDARSAGKHAGLSSVRFIDAVHGWAVGNRFLSYARFNPLILATDDGGATWTAQDARGADSTAQLRSVTFVGAAHGWAVGVDSSSGTPPYTPVILATNR